MIACRPHHTLVLASSHSPPFWFLPTEQHFGTRTIEVYKTLMNMSPVGETCGTCPSPSPTSTAPPTLSSPGSRGCFSSHIPHNPRECILRTAAFSSAATPRVHRQSAAGMSTHAHPDTMQTPSGFPPCTPAPGSRCSQLPGCSPPTAPPHCASALWPRPCGKLQGYLSREAGPVDGVVKEGGIGGEC